MLLLILSPGNAAKMGKRIMKRIIALAVGLATLALSAPRIEAQDAYPNKPIKMLLAFAPGGATDINSRQFAQALSKQLGQPVIVENKPGAGGNIGATEAARSAPDGYTIFYATSAIVLTPSLYPKLPFDPFKDFIPVTLTATVPLVLVTSPNLDAKDVNGLIALAKTKPDGLSYASSGAGAILHLAGAHFSAENGLKTTHIPYKGSALAVTDLTSGRVDFMFMPLNEAVGHVRSGRLKGLAVTTAKRVPVLPDMPTLSEAMGKPVAEMGAWQGIVVPAGTPQAIVDRLSTEILKAQRSPELIQQLEAQGSVILGGSAADYTAYMKQEFDRWADVIKTGKITIE
jgi:tripartite-type tricarboxylate transporter receptor subunit TctC